MIQSITSSILKPKPKTFPKGLIYNLPNSGFYKLIDLKKGQVVGEMIADIESNSVRNIYNVSPNKKVFKISSLEIDWRQQRKGWGKYFMNFAKKESYKQGCEGRLYLIAYNPFESPHIFYKKQGLMTNDKRIDDRLNSYIKKKSIFTSYPACIMYLPLKDVAKKEEQIIKINFWDKVRNFLIKKIVR